MVQLLAWTLGLGSLTRVHEPPPVNVPVPAPVRLKSTSPSGSDLPPASVSVTVTSQLAAWLIARGSSQSTTVEVVRSVTVMSSKPELEAWSAEDASDRKSTRLNSSHANISYAVFCLKKKKNVNIYFIFFSTLHLPSTYIPLFFFFPPPFFLSSYFTSVHLSLAFSTFSQLLPLSLLTP